MFHKMISDVLESVELAANSLGEDPYASGAVIRVLVYHFDRDERMGVSIGLYCGP
jgi:hypothetical protein